MAGPMTLMSPKHAWQLRLLGVLVAAPCIAMLVTAAMLSPAACLFGTARQLGVPGCSWLARTGWPCPSCGLTTSVAAAVHGDVVGSLRAQPFGLVLALAAGTLAVAGILQVVVGRNLLAVFRLGRWWVLGGLAGMLLGWAVKLIVGFADGTWPLR